MTEFLDTDGGRIAYGVIGQGPPVVLSRHRRPQARLSVPFPGAGPGRLAGGQRRPARHGESTMAGRQSPALTSSAIGSPSSVPLGGPAVVALRTTAIAIPDN